MRSPFPGMDPYLERYWDDVHNRLCTHVSGSLQPNLPKGLKARAAQDVRLTNVGDNGVRRHEQLFEGDTVTVEPIVVGAMPLLERDQWVQIIDTADGNRVVTVIEILSPGNKRSGDLDRRYRRKLSKYIEGGVNVVEIDLLRSSRTRLPVTRGDIPEDRRTAYYTCLNRISNSFEWLAYPMSLREPLPAIPIPCRERDPDVWLPLQPIIDRIYVEGGHEDIDYAVPPRPPLSPADAAWAADLIANRLAPPVP